MSEHLTDAHMAPTLVNEPNVQQQVHILQNQLNAHGNAIIDIQKATNTILTKLERVALDEFSQSNPVHIPSPYIPPPPTTYQSYDVGTPPHLCLPKGYKPQSLDTFSGLKNEDLDSWLFLATEHFKLVGITDDETKIIISGLSFRQHAKTWYMSVRGPHVPPEDVITSWEVFKDTLIDHFSPVEAAKIARDELATLKQTTSVRDYTARFRQLCAIIKTIADGEMLDRYIRGLKHKIQKDVWFRAPKTFQEASKIAAHVDTLLDGAYTDNYPSRDNSPYERSSRPTPMDIDLNAINHSSNRRQVRWADRSYSPSRQRDRFHGNGHLSSEGHRPRGRRLTREEYQGRKDRNECLYCGSKDHQVQFCPVAPPRRQGNGHGHPPRDA